MTSSPLKWTLAGDPASFRPKQAVVAGMLFAGEVAALTAPPFTGKSVIAARLAVDVMAGRPFFGRPVLAGSALFVAAEREHETRPRITAMRDGGPDVPVLGRSIDEPFDLRSSRFVERLTSTMKDVEDRTGRPLRLLVLDTIARLQPGADEISAKDMGLVADAMARLADFGPAVVTLCHPPKSGGGLRGSGAIEGAVDRILELRPGKAGLLTLAVAQANSGQEGTSVSFRLASAQVGRDESSETVAIAVPAVDEDVGFTSKSPTDTIRDAIVLDILRETGSPMARKALLAEMRARGALSENKDSSVEQLRKCLARLKAICVLEYDDKLVRLQANPNPTPAPKGPGVLGSGHWAKKKPKIDEIGPDWASKPNTPNFGVGR